VAGNFLVRNGIGCASIADIHNLKLLAWELQITFRIFAMQVFDD